MTADKAIAVLLIEDNLGDSRLIEIHLAEQTGYLFRVTVRPTLDEGLRTLGEGGIDVVLLDLSLPDSQGLETLRVVLEQAGETPVVVLSGLDDVALTVRAVQNGAQDYLVKGRGDGEVIRRAILHAIERQRFRSQLLMAEAVFNHTGTGMMVTDANGMVTRVNPAFLDVTGFTESEVVGRTAWVLSSDLHDPSFHQDMRRHLDQTGTWEGEVWSRRRDGSIHPEWLRVNAVQGPTGTILGYVTIFSDLTFRARAEEDLVRQATTDALTGLPNRALFGRLLASGVQRALRYDRLLGLLFIDLDGFKAVNDRFGHEAGDDVLREVARRLRRAVRLSDEVARLGGDEFTVLLSEVRGLEDAEMVAAKVVQALGAPFMVLGERVPLSASVGIATVPTHGADAEQLLRAADEAMYAAKKAGKNRYTFARRAGL
ncbi:diguanylate cyclase domain-containing protein [Pararhodospirillum oryzae]|uniref:Guanylate cyclase n=1 Tax=Pararhodospirillum oryzae TaxID=478448 RepID=A0A512H6G2_9PROT|nr:diguanylate cyclase [Pararhodospirillum oryzae]GEO81018.1 guanylate cyclase [Pararhodospirillum oryzae]